MCYVFEPLDATAGLMVHGSCADHVHGSMSAFLDQRALGACFCTRENCYARVWGYGFGQDEKGTECDENVQPPLSAGPKSPTARSADGRQHSAMAVSTQP